MLPVIKSLFITCQTRDVTIVAGARMIAKATQKQIEATGLLFILGIEIPQVSCVVALMREQNG